jgi:hypothetical protein
MMEKKDLAFGKNNFILLGIGAVVVLLGFILMSGGGSTAEAYNPDIFSARRIKVAPIVCLIGFVVMIYAVVLNPDRKLGRKSKQED